MCEKIKISIKKMEEILFTCIFSLDYAAKYMFYYIKSINSFSWPSQCTNLIIESQHRFSKKKLLFIHIIE